MHGISADSNPEKYRYAVNYVLSLRENTRSRTWYEMEIPGGC